MFRITVFAVLLLGCGRAPVSQEVAGDLDEPVEASAITAQPEPAHARVESPGPAPFLSRYSPTRGVIGTRVRILGTFAEHPSENIVTIGGVKATVLPNDFLLEVLVPPGAVTGPLCVTARGQTVCGEIFTLLPGPVLYQVSPNPVHLGTDAKLALSGDGFVGASVVLLDGLPLKTSLTEYGGLEAELPTALASGTWSVSVKNGLRCGVESLPLSISVR